jgi:hypothetical protein
MTGENIFGIIIVIVFIGSALTDLILELSWNKRYFTSGLPIFVRRIPVSRWHTNIPSQALLEKKFHSDVIASIVFRQFNAYSYIFRERLFQFRWIRTPDLMHGWLMFDHFKGEVIVIGFINFSAIAFCIIWLGFQLVGIIPIILGRQPISSLWMPVFASTMFILFSILMYEIQAARFSIVADFAAESWARKYVRDGDGEA